MKYTLIVNIVINTTTVVILIPRIYNVNVYNIKLSMNMYMRCTNITSTYISYYHGNVLYIYVPIHVL